MPKRPIRQTTLPPTVPTTQGSFTQPTPPWVDWSAWIAEFWKALTSMTGGQSDWMSKLSLTFNKKFYVCFKSFRSVCTNISQVPLQGTFTKLNT
jgi:hypothetical protein